MARNATEEARPPTAQRAARGAAGSWDERPRSQARGRPRRSSASSRRPPGSRRAAARDSLPARARERAPGSATRRERHGEASAEARVDVRHRKRSVGSRKHCTFAGPLIPTALRSGRRTRSSSRSLSRPLDRLAALGQEHRARNRIQAAAVHVAEDVDRELLAETGLLHERRDVRVREEERELVAVRWHDRCCASRSPRVPSQERESGRRPACPRAPSSAGTESRSRRRSGAPRACPTCGRRRRRRAGARAPARAARARGRAPGSRDR